MFYIIFVAYFKFYSAKNFVNDKGWNLCEKKSKTIKFVNINNSNNNWIEAT